VGRVPQKPLQKQPTPIQVVHESISGWCQR